MEANTPRHCCAMHQLNVYNNTSADIIIRTMENLHRTAGRTTFCAIALLPNENTLRTTLLSLGFKPTIQFNRREYYDQRIKLVEFFIEPQFINNKMVKGVNKALYPNEEGVFEPMEQPVKIKKATTPTPDNVITLTLMHRHPNHSIYRARNWDRLWRDTTIGSRTSGRIYENGGNAYASRRKLAHGTFNINGEIITQ